MDAVSKQEAAVVIAKLMVAIPDDQVTAVMNIATWMLGLTDDQIAAIVQTAKDINAALPAEATVAEKKQIHRAVIHIGVDPGMGVIQALGLKPTIKA